ncbi:serine/threonine protein kinase [Kitasatospora sp. GP30]|uniref:serine/threonine-protein kinase n=1 Tax=Kitasatospora sp. GP30 TaxID=3035084 RepID=UPI000C70276B|nr:serine/threonine-protein kinase [Kitasatospora sp. GP30]MDH6142199.1 serine/threonine protein kinase [Kitasatospora sp. GP30]
MFEVRGEFDGSGVVKALQEGDPARVGPYELVAVLGSGGMGKVYLGQRDGVAVAVKVINGELAHDAEFLARFRREVVATRAVSGPYVAAVVDHDVDAEQPWLATEYVPGPSLHAVIAEHGPLGVVPVRALGMRLAEALAAIHEAGLVHRDVKPGNILLGPDGPRLIDFGVARGAAVTTLTQTGVLLGTPQFMAPEQLQGKGRVGPAADVFALGLVLAFAATGQHPFGQTDSFGFGFRIVYEEPNLDAVPAELVEVVRSCLVKDPEQRLTTEALGRALNLGEATLDVSGVTSLREYAAHPPTIPVLPEGPKSGRRAQLRRPWVIAAAAAVVISVVVAAVLGLDGRTTADNQGLGSPSASHPGSSVPATPTAGSSGASGSPSSAAPSSSPPSSSPSAAPSSGAPSLTQTPSGATASPPKGSGSVGTGGGSAPGTGGNPGGISGSATSAGNSGGTPGGTSGGSTPPPSPAPPQGSPPPDMTQFSYKFNEFCAGACSMPLTVSWTALSGATRYDIHYDNQTAKVDTIYSATGTSYVINGPYSGDHICLTMRAANQYGASAWTQTGCFDVPY